MLEKYLTPTAFAKKVKLSRERVHQLIRDGRVRYEKIGSRYFIPKDEKIQAKAKGAKNS